MKKQESTLWAAFEINRSTGNRNQLIEWYLPFARAISLKISQRIPSNLVDGDDLFQESIFALMKCIDRFDPICGSEFTSFVSPRIRGQILDCLRRLDWVNRTDRPLINRIERELEASGPIDDCELAEKTGLTESTCQRLRGGWEEWARRGAGGSLELCEA